MLTAQDHQFHQPVPAEEWTMQVVHSHGELETNLKQIFEDDLPGFVIRAAGVDSIPLDHEARVETIIAALNEIDGIRDPKIPFRFVFPNWFEAKTGKGRLHSDPNGTKLRAINIHTTTFGAGKVLLANGGPVYADMAELKPKNETSREFDERMGHERIASQIDRGEVSPNMISPVLHTTKVSQGDTVVMPFINNRGPVLHRFDTSSPRRRADISAVGSVRRRLFGNRSLH